MNFVGVRMFFVYGPCLIMLTNYEFKRSIILIESVVNFLEAFTALDG